MKTDIGTTTLTVMVKTLCFEIANLEAQAVEQQKEAQELLQKIDKLKAKLEEKEAVIMQLQKDLGK